MATFTKDYSGLGGPLEFDVLFDYVDLNGLITTVTAEIGSAYVLTDDFIIYASGLSDSIGTADGADSILDFGGAATTISAGAGNDTITIGDTFTGGSIDGGADFDRLEVTGLALSFFDLTLLDISSIEELLFSNSGSFVNVASNQLGGTGLSSALALIGSPNTDVIFVNGSGPSNTIDLLGWTFTAWNSAAGDAINIFGGAGDDVITGTSEADTISSFEGNDTIIDTAGTSTTIDAGEGDDTITIGDTFTSGSIDGGADIDTLAMFGPADLSSITLTNLERLETNGEEVTATAVQFDAFERIAYDNLNLDFGVTLQLAATGGATVLDLSDELSDGRPVGVVTAAYITGSSDDETITTGAGNDRIDGGAGNDVLSGAAGDDEIIDTAGISTAIDGGDGDDTITIGGTFTSGTIDGGADTDTLVTQTALDLTLAGMTCSNIERLSTSGQTITGQAAQFDAFDRIAWDIAFMGEPVVLRLAATGSATVLDLSDELSDGRSVGIASAVDIIGSSDSETITAGVGNDNMAGGLGPNNSLSGNDALNGGDGDDTLTAHGSDSDALNGGQGNDTLFATASSTNTNHTLNGDEGNDFILATVGTVAAISGGTGNDRFGIGTNFTSGTIDGGADLDNLELPVGGFGGGDTNLAGLTLVSIEQLGTNIHTVTGRAEQFEAFDRISQDNFDLISHVRLALAATGSATVLDISDELADGRPVGLARSVTITGSTDSETITTGRGADTLNGGAGDDVLDGGAGTASDILNGGADNDTASYASLTGGTGVTVSLAIAGSQNTIGAGTDTLISIENLTGSAFADTLTGSIGANLLSGGAGNDTIIGDPGTLPSGVFFNATTGKYYQRANLNLNFTSAQANAAATQLGGVNGRLVTILSADENTYVSSTVALGLQYWIGASDAAVEGDWRWLSTNQQFWSGTFTGGPVGGLYNGWGINQPDNALFVPEGEDAAVSNWLSFAGVWNDLSRTDVTGSVIELGHRMGRSRNLL